MRRMLALLRQRMRRDGLQLTLWIVGTVLLGALSYVGVSQTYGTETDRANLLAAAIANPVILLFRGLPEGAGTGPFIAFLIVPFLVMLAAFMSTFLAVRHTRADEELDRAEVIAATPAGRVLPLVATIVHGVLANVVLAILVAASFAALGLSVAGSVLVGAATGSVGVAFFGFALLAAQLVRTSRAANSVAVWAIVITFLISGVGNAIGTPSADLQSVQSSWLAWLSPFGWAENTRPYATDNALPLLLTLGIAVACTAGAFVLQAARDIGGSLLPERRSRATAGAALGSSFGLVWRLSRGAVIGWAVGGLVSGLLATRLSDVIAQVSVTIPSVQAIMQALAAGGTLQQGIVVIFFTMVGILAACCAVQTVCRARQEEAHGTAEPVLAAVVGRVHWLADYVLVALVGIVVTIGAGVAGAALGLATLSEPDWSLLGDVIVTGAGQMAAAAVFLVITALVFVLVPRLTIAVGWTLVVVGTILGLFGSLFGFPQALVDVSPFAVTPTVTANAVDLRGLWWLVLAVAVGAAASLTLMRRRELAGAE
ncbi:polyketide antibiotic transporter [Microbacterium sp. X-17]|uniref:ABC transporter permease n=1 Tax=Microbacterium sp. X-17 TaxID=3144404 RepID=UPI0031F571E6